MTVRVVRMWTYLRPKLKAQGVRDPMKPEMLRRGFAFCPMSEHWIRAEELGVDERNGKPVGCRECVVAHAGGGTS